ncbi:MAG: type III polyketide synthase [Planctomycetaceae bacterium]|jgi:alkylresorcinol/alkylpyrone synthase|nr:type III polyketide synthase [Planctomycetaceae bacterium]
MDDQQEPATIISIATGIPDGVIDQDVAAGVVQRLGITKRWNKVLPKLYQKSGVRRRSSVLLGPDHLEPDLRQSFYTPPTETAPYGPTTAQRMEVYAQHAGPLICKTSRLAIDRAGITPSRITHLVTVSCTGFVAPGLDHALIQAHKLRETVQRVHVGFMGCHAMVNGLRVAQAICQADGDAVALVSSVELCSIHQQYSEDPEQIVANSLFSDGSASAIVVPYRQALAMPQVDPSWRMVSSLSLKVPDSADLMTWKIGDHGFQMTLSSQVPMRIEGELRAPLETWLGTLGVSTKEIKQWVVHPGGPRILDAVEEAIGLGSESLSASRETLANYGNMSSPTIVFIMEEILRRSESEGLPREKGLWLVLGFGPGLHAEAILLERV